MQYLNTVVHISQLAVTSDIISDAVFTNCLIQGPAVLMAVSEVALNECEWTGSPEAIFWPIESCRQAIVGAIGLRHCTFTGCRFQGIGFAYPESEAEELLKNFRVAERC